ncbi:MAG: ATP-binding protein [Actinomycetota bacterium]
MLKRIKIRGKLLLMLLAPLLALLFFSYTGVTDRSEEASAGSREARLAAFVESSGDLATALQIERFNTQLSGRLMLNTAETRPDEIATDAALAAWLETTSAVRDDLQSATLGSFVDTTRIDLIASIDDERRTESTPTELEVRLDQLATDVNRIIAGTANEATSVELFRSLGAARSLISIQSELVAIANVGDTAIAEGQVPSSAPIVLATATNNITVAFDDVAPTLSGSDRAALDQLLTDDLLPRLVASETTDNRGGFNPTLEIGRALNLGVVEGSVSWTEENAERVSAVTSILADVLRETEQAASFNAAFAQEQSTQFLLLALSVTILALLTAIVVGASVSQPLIELTDTARRLSSEELPAMVESMRTAGRADTTPVTPIEAKGRDEVAQLSRAFAEIQSVTVEVAEEQGSLLRRGISDIFVNLARRNQSLLDRQIDFIDQLESREENPDQLENLFRLDHLATRMRRNAESLLVLAGAEPSRRRGRPVELSDVIRVAVGEIEDFSRIDLANVESATVAGSVAVDLAHLLSELMENATQFSPPDTDVNVVGERDADGSYRITLVDHGIGMSADQLATANATLAEPPVIGLELSRSLGFTVVSRLSHRLGVSVRLAQGAPGGVVAVLSIPPEMIGYVEVAEPQIDASTPADHAPPVPSSPAPEFPPAATLPPILPTAASPVVPAPIPAPPSAPTPEPTAPPQPVTAAPATPTLPQRTPTPTPPSQPKTAAPTSPPAVAERPAAPPVGPSGLPTRVPTPPAAPDITPASVPTTAHNPSGDLFELFGSTPTEPTPPIDPEADLFAPLDATGSGPTAAAPSAPQIPTAAPPIAPPAPAGGEASAPTSVPNVEAVPQPHPAVATIDDAVTSAGLIRRTPKQVDVPEESKYAPAATPAPPAMSAGNRSPEEVRQMLSRYRAGLRKGRGPVPGSSDTNPK